MRYFTGKLTATITLPVEGSTNEGEYAVRGEARIQFEQLMRMHGGTIEELSISVTEDSEPVQIRLPGV